MNHRIKFIILLFILLIVVFKIYCISDFNKFEVLSFKISEQSGAIKSIEFAEPGGVYGDRTLHVFNSSPDFVTTINSFRVDGVECRLIKSIDAPIEFKVERQFETGLMILGESRQYGLLDWKHHISKWETLDCSHDVFFSPIIEKRDFSRFPQVSVEELQNAVFKALTDYKIPKAKEISEKCRNINEAPCQIEISKVRFQISAKFFNKWEPIKKFECVYPKFSINEKQNLKTIEFLKFDQEKNPSEKIINISMSDIVKKEINIYETVANQILQLQFSSNESDDVKVEQQFETKFVISLDEDDFELDGRKFISEWKELKQTSKNRFLTNIINQEESQYFPEFTDKELCIQILKEFNVDENDRFISEKEHSETYKYSMKLVENVLNCGQPSGKCIGQPEVTTIRFRIKIKENGKWKVIKVVEVLQTFGC